MKNVLIVFGTIEFIGNHAIVHRIKNAVCVSQSIAEKAAEVIAGYDDYIIPQLYKGTIEWKN